MARLDRLSDVKDVAHLASTLGRMFSHDLLAAVSTLDEATLRLALEQLVDAELIYQRGDPPDAIYEFKHALVQDAAYSSLLRSRRLQFHRRIGEGSSSVFPRPPRPSPSCSPIISARPSCRPRRSPTPCAPERRPPSAMRRPRRAPASRRRSTLRARCRRPRTPPAPRSKPSSSSRASRRTAPTTRATSRPSSRPEVSPKA